MSTELRTGSTEAPINFFTLLLKIYFMGHIHQYWVISVYWGNLCSQNAKLNYFGSQVYFPFFPASLIINAQKFLKKTILIQFLHPKNFWAHTIFMLNTIQGVSNSCHVLVSCQNLYTFFVSIFLVFSAFFAQVKRHEEFFILQFRSHFIGGRRDEITNISNFLV